MNIKKCPFCGSEGKMDFRSLISTGDLLYFISCENGHFCNNEAHYSQEKAIEAWNQRPEKRSLLSDQTIPLTEEELVEFGQQFSFEHKFVEEVFMHNGQIKFYISNIDDPFKLNELKPIFYLLKRFNLFSGDENE